VGGPYAHDAGHGDGAGLELAQALVDFLQGAGGVGQEDAAGFRHDDPLPDAVEQRLPHLILQLADLVRQRRLGHVNALGRPREVQRTRQRDEIPEVSEFHGAL
jgi:hypothetical protein